MSISFKKNKHDMQKVFFIALILAALMFLPFVIYDKGLFIYYGDFDVQQIPFYRLAHSAVQNGEWGWNWNTDLGANFIGSYSFYNLGSPFFWLTTLFPNAAVPYLMAPLLVLKFALTAVTGYSFINRFTKTSQMAVYGGLIYAFSGFNIYNIFFNHFNEVVMLFPLLLISMEEFVINKRRGMFALMVAACALMNYYFFFGEVIFCVLYFIIRSRSDDFKVDLKTFGLMALEAVIGLMLSAFLLLPSLMALIGNTRTSDTIEGFNAIVYGNSQRYGLIISSLFFPPDIPARPNFFPDSNAKWSSVSLFLPMFSTVGVFAYFRANKKSFIKTVLVASGIIALVPFLNASFSAFNYSYYARWFFMPLLIMSLATAISLESHMDEFPFAIKVTAGFVGFFTLIGIMPKRIDGELKWFSLPQYPERFWVYVLIAVFGILIVTLLYMMTNKHKLFNRIITISLSTIILTTSVFMIFTGKLQGNGYEVVVEDGIYGADKLNLMQKGFYRIDSFDQMDNLGMTLGLPTINAFHSVVPSSIVDYYNLIGEKRSVGSRPAREHAGIRALLNVKYEFVREEKDNGERMLGFSYYDRQNGYVIYQNDYFVPIGVGMKNLITANDMAAAGSYKDRLLLKGLYIAEPEENPTGKNMDLDELDDLEYMKSVPINVDTQYIRYENRLTHLKRSEAMSSTLSKDEDYFKSCAALASNSVSQFNYDSTGFWATFQADEPQFVLFSVPYDRGFSATVNGVPTEIIKANGGFMAVEVGKGNNAIVFSYKTPGLLEGLMVTIAALLMFAGYMAFCYYLRKKHPMQYRYDKKAHLPTVEPSVDALYIDESKNLPE